MTAETVSLWRPSPSVTIRPRLRVLALRSNHSTRFRHGLSTLPQDSKPISAYREVTKQQCPAVSFLSQLRSVQKARFPHLDIDREALNDGEVLNGMVDHYGSRQVALLLVSDTGNVQNVSNLLKPGTDAKTFNIGIKRPEGAAGRQPQLLIAVATPRCQRSPARRAQQGG